MSIVEYVDPLVDDELERVLGEFAAVMVVGPRACGKTTTSMRLAESVVRLDQPAMANVFRFDPDAALAERAEPVLLDEWQDAPEVLGAVKRSVDAEPRPGRFVLTGSVSGEVEAASWPGTGRLIRVPMSVPGLWADQRPRPSPELLAAARHRRDRRRSAARAATGLRHRRIADGSACRPRPCEAVAAHVRRFAPAAPPWQLVVTITRAGVLGPRLRLIFRCPNG